MCHQGNANQNNEILVQSYYNAPNSNTNDTKSWQESEQQKLTHCWWDCKIVQPLWKTIWQFHKKLNTFLPYNSAILLPGIYPKELKNYIYTKTCT